MFVCHFFFVECEEYSEAVYEKITIGNGINAPPLVRRESKCAIASVPFIVGGEPASPREFPHMVNIVVRVNEPTNSPQHVLSIIF